MTTQPLPNPPFLAVSGVPNLRDIGGYPTPHLRPGHVVRPGVLYRAAAPSPASGAALAALPVTQIFDLRSGSELERRPGPAPSASPPLEQHHVPVWSGESYSPDAIALRFSSYANSDPALGFGRAYADILAAGAAGAFAPLLRHLARGDAVQRPALVHCTAGKDRTGVACALVLALCGVPDDVIAWEYSLTERGLEPLMPEFVAALLRHPTFQDDPDGARRMMGARPESMLSTLSMLRQKYGSVEDYVRNECGLSDADIAQLQDNLVVDASTVDKAALPALPTF